MNKQSPGCTTFIPLLPSEQNEGKAITVIYHIVTGPTFSLVFFYGARYPCTLCSVQFWQFCTPWI